MNTFNKRIEFIKSFFPEYFNGDDTNEPTPSVHEHEEINIQDIDIGTKLLGKFNVESGFVGLPSTISPQAFKNDGYKINSEYRREKQVHHQYKHQ